VASINPTQHLYSHNKSNLDILFCFSQVQVFLHPGARGGGGEEEEEEERGLTKDHKRERERV
jgi:hypothetical protein